MEIAYVTSQGRLAVPSRLRRKYGIKPGTKICFIESDGEILARSNPRLEPIPLRSSERVIFTWPERDGSAAALLGALNVPASHLRRETLVPAGKQSKGTCAYCGQELTMGGTAKHLTACPERETVIDKAERKKTGSETLYHLRALDMWRSEFWLDLEMRGSSTLKDLDFYLRGIWLECCGHLSRFSVGGWRGKEISKRRRVDEVFKPGIKLTHIYDFGTSSETLIKAVGTRGGKPTTARPVALMARNIMPDAKCIECEQPAAWLCIECLIEEDVWGTLCDAHGKTHPHDNYGEPIRLLNSPRLGMCGYEGPAEPPY